MFGPGIPCYKWSRIAPKRPRLELEVKPFNKHGSSIDAAQSGVPPDLWLWDGLGGVDGPLKQEGRN